MDNQYLFDPDFTHPTETFASKVKTPAPPREMPPSWGGPDRINFSSSHPKISTPMESDPPTLASGNNWQYVSHKKWNSKSRSPIVGAAKSAIQAVKVVKTSSVFITRCQPETTCDDIKAYLINERQWNIKGVQSVNTKYQTYRSFRVDILRADNTPESEYLKPAHWPENTLIARFNRPRWTGPLLGSTKLPSKWLTSSVGTVKGSNQMDPGYFSF